MDQLGGISENWPTPAPWYVRGGRDAGWPVSPGTIGNRQKDVVSANPPAERARSLLRDGKWRMEQSGSKCCLVGLGKHR
jgi:hypothetical protein